MLENQSTDLNLLRNQLSEFGLNPREWRVCPRWESGLFTQLEVRSLDDGSCTWVGWAVQNVLVSLAAESVL